MIGQLFLGLGKDFWARNRLASGNEIDQVREQNIPRNSKTIDRTVGMSCVVSHKSTDIRLKSYLLPGSIYRTGIRFCRELAIYGGEIRRNHKIGATYYLTWAVADPETKDRKSVV